MILVCLLLGLLLSCQAGAPHPSPSRAPSAGTFSLVVQEQREEHHPSSLGGTPTAVRVQMDTRLYGHTGVDVTPGATTLVVYADSIRLESTSPYVYRTFLSADTVYYSARGGTGAIAVDLETMLGCLFDGPALRARYGRDGALDQVLHVNARCQSGAYERINLPVTLGAFLSLSVAPHSTGSRWREIRAVPSFSGLSFHPDVEWSYRLAKGRNGKVVVISADTTIVDFPLSMKNGENITIVRNRMRITGTLNVEEGEPIPRTGRLRVREELVYLRSKGGTGPVRKSCDYTIRLDTDR